MRRPVPRQGNSDELADAGKATTMLVHLSDRAVGLAQASCVKKLNAAMRG
jgi:hypothetical protein